MRRNERKEKMRRRKEEKMRRIKEVVKEESRRSIG